MVVACSPSHVSRAGELLPRQAQIADKLAIVRSFQVARDLQHALHEVYTGFAGEANQEFPGGRAVRPAFGSVVSQLRGQQELLPSYVSLRTAYTSRAVGVAEDPAYLGTAHRPFVPSGPAMRSQPRRHQAHYPSMRNSIISPCLLAGAQ
jgi:hypothetical protein